jgi:hypothetical protein
MSKIQLAQIKGAFRHVMDLQARERKFLLAEIMQVKGLMPLLMKRRNKQNWSVEDKAELRDHLRRLSHISPYIAIMILPGSFLMLPILAWWLDRRRQGAPEQRNKFKGDGSPAGAPPAPPLSAAPGTPAAVSSAPVAAVAGSPQVPIQTD